jgi:isorenieratene synthase
MTQPIIIGGGISGLMAAAHLAERGLSPLLLEANPTWLGGRLRNGPVVEIEAKGAATKKVWRFPGEHGVHGIWAPYTNLLATLARYDILPNLIPARDETWIRGEGRTVRRAAIGNAIRRSTIPAPFHYLELFTRPRFLNMLTLRDLLSLPFVMGKLFSAMAIDPLAEGKSLKGMSLADFTAGWSPNIRSLFAGLARNALAAHPAEVPASGFIAFLRFYTLLRRDAWAFAYLPGPGGSCIAEPLADVAQQLGAEIRLGWRAKALERQAGQWRIACVTAEGKAQMLEADYLILALDAPSAQTLLTTSPATKEKAAALRFPLGVATAIIRLWFARQPKAISEAGMFSGDFVIDNFFWLDRLQPAYQEWRRATGGSAIEMHIYGPPELLAEPDALLLARVITDCYRAFPELRGHLLHQVLLRNDATHTLFSVGEADEHLAIQTPWPNLFACGDWVYHPAPALYLERAAVTGIAAANALLTELALSPWPLLPHPAPEWLAGKLSSFWWRVRQLMLQYPKASP